MTKGSYHILLRGAEAKRVDGYLFTRGGYRFGVHWTGRTWVVSELSTGCQVCWSNSRSAAVSRVDQAMLKRMDDTFRSDRGQTLAAYQEAISRAAESQ